MDQIFALTMGVEKLLKELDRRLFAVFVNSKALDRYEGIDLWIVLRIYKYGVERQ